MQRRFFDVARSSSFTGRLSFLDSSAADEQEKRTQRKEYQATQKQDPDTLH